MTVVVGIFAMESTQEPSGAWWVLTTSRDEALVWASPRAARERVNLRLYLALQPFCGQGYPHSQQGATSLQIGQRQTVGQSGQKQAWGCLHDWAGVKHEGHKSHSN